MRWDDDEENIFPKVIGPAVSHDTINTSPQGIFPKSSFAGIHRYPSCGTAALGEKFAIYDQ